MTPDYTIWEEIDKYLNGELTGSEKDAFEQRLLTDKTLRHKLDEQANLQYLLQQAAAKKEIRHTLHNMQQELSVERGGKILSFDNWQEWIRQHSALLATAAAVTVLAVMTTVSMLASTGFIVRKQKTAYQELQRDIENLQRSQKQIIRNMSESPASPELADYSGTAVAISADGYLITSYHMVKNARRIVVENEEYGAMTAEKWITNPELDLAILKLDSSSLQHLKLLPVAISYKLIDLGEEVYTLGYPREDLVYGQGSISSLTGYRNDTTAYQISIPVNPGNSGGPLFDRNGNLVGLISGKNSKEEGTAFAIKSANIAEYLGTLDGNLAFKLNKKNALKGLQRPDQLKKAQPYVFMVKVYKGN